MLNDKCLFGPKTCLVILVISIATYCRFLLKKLCTSNFDLGLFQQKQQQSFGSSSNPMQASLVGGLFTQQTPLGSGLHQTSNSGLFTEKNLFSGNNPQSSNLFGQNPSNQANKTATGPVAGLSSIQVSPSVSKQQIVCSIFKCSNARVYIAT